MNEFTYYQVAGMPMFRYKAKDGIIYRDIPVDFRKATRYDLEIFAKELNMNE